MKDTDAAGHLCALLNLMPRLQAAYAAGDFDKVLELGVYSRENSKALVSHAISKLQQKEVPAVEKQIPERPLVRAWFPGQI